MENDRHSIPLKTHIYPSSGTLLSQSSRRLLRNTLFRDLLKKTSENSPYPF